MYLFFDIYRGGCPPSFLIFIEGVALHPLFFDIYRGSALHPLFLETYTYKKGGGVLRTPSFSISIDIYSPPSFLIFIEGGAPPLS